MRDVAALGGREPEDGVARGQRRAGRLARRPRAGHGGRQPARLPTQPGRQQPAPRRRPHRPDRRAGAGPVELVLRQPSSSARGLRAPPRHGGARRQPRRGRRPRAGARPRPGDPPGRRAGDHAGERAPGLPRQRAALGHPGRVRRPPAPRRRRRLGHRRQPPRWPAGGRAPAGPGSPPDRRAHRPRDHPHRRAPARRVHRRAMPSAACARTRAWW